jgi:hypothetical protein
MGLEPSARFEIVKPVMLLAGETSCPLPLNASVPDEITLFAPGDKSAAGIWRRLREIEAQYVARSQRVINNHRRAKRSRRSMSRSG